MLKALRNWWVGQPVVEEAPPKPKGPVRPEEFEVIETERTGIRRKARDWQLSTFPNQMWDLMRKGGCRTNKFGAFFKANEFLFWGVDHHEMQCVLDAAAKEAGWFGVTISSGVTGPEVELWRVDPDTV